MKKILLFLGLTFSAFFASGQTAANFNCNDCASINHDLFTELNSGKIIVITWAMPCSACINGGLAAQSAAQSFSLSNPNQVLTYVADDYANTTCTSLSSWCSTNGISPDAKFSNSAVSMSPYGAAGMPKVIVVGGNSHTVYYNQNGGAITQAGIQAAINSALTANVTQLKENNTVLTNFEVYPNPSIGSNNLSINLSKETKVKIKVENILGQTVIDVYTGSLTQGDNIMTINTNELANGNYFITYFDGELSKKVKLIVTH